MITVEFEVRRHDTVFFLSKEVDGHTVYTKKTWKWEEDAEEYAKKEEANPNPRLSWNRY